MYMMHIYQEKSRYVILQFTVAWSWKMSVSK